MPEHDSNIKEKLRERLKQRQQEKQMELKPFDVVRTVFTGFTQRQAEQHRQNKMFWGGQVRPGVRHILSDKKILKAPHYHVESTFNDEEIKYIVRINTLLIELAQGKVDGVALSAHITELFRAQVDKSFGLAIKDAVFDCIRRFAQHYPSLTPALNAMFSQGGGDGTFIAVTKSAKGVYDQLQYSNEMLTVAEDQPLESFVGTHPFVPTSEVDFELWCTGMGFAFEIMNQTAQSAQELLPELLPYHRDPFKFIEVPYFKKEVIGLARSLYETEMIRHSTQ